MLAINLRARDEMRNASHPGSGEARNPQHRLHRLCTVGWIFIVTVASPLMPSVEAQSSIEELRVLREEVEKLRQEMAALRGELQNQRTVMSKLFANGGNPPTNGSASSDQYRTNSDQDRTNEDMPVSQAVPVL